MDRQTDRQRATIAYTTLAKHHAAKNSSTDPNLGKITNWYQTFFTDSERMRLHGVWGKRSCCQPLTTCVVTILIIYHASSLWIQFVIMPYETSKEYCKEQNVVCLLYIFSIVLLSILRHNFDKYIPKFKCQRTKVLQPIRTATFFLNLKCCPLQSATRGTYTPLPFHRHCSSTTILLSERTLFPLYAGSPMSVPLLERKM